MMQYKLYGLTLERLKEVLSYDQHTGIFTWIKNYHTSKIGRVAGHKSKKYVEIKIDQKKYHAHCLAWLYMTGKWPKDEIDHRDRVKHNNRFNNLREATGIQNKANQGPRAKKFGTLKGVCWIPKRRRRQASFRRKFIGYFLTELEAHRAYMKKAKQVHGEFARAA